MNTKLDFINGNTKKCLLAMTLPMIVAMFLNMAYNLVDSLWIGNLLGELAYAALTNSTPIVLLLTSVAMGATNGISILLSQAIGARNEQKKKKVISTSFCIAVIFSLFITFILELFLPVILAALNTPAETMNMARDYLSIYLLGYIAVYLYLYFTAVLRSFGNTIFQVIAMLISTILNIVLDPIFILKIGFHGAAIATLLSQSMCLIFMIIYILKQIQENEYISKKLSMVAMINKKMQKYVIVTEKFGEKNERKRLARELHDTIGHALAGMAVGVDACITMIDKNPQLAKAQLKIISKAIRKGMKDVRNSLNKMRPDFLQQYRLKEAIEKMKEEISDVTDLKINLNYQIDETGFDTKIEDILFRVIQESITNSIRHGLATVVDIDIYKENNLLCLKIKDNGKGCKAINYGFGLKQMVERVSQIRGDINFYSENGFTTEIKIPL